MRFHVPVLSSLLAVALAAALSAQDTEQNFRATFFPDPNDVPLPAPEPFVFEKWGAGAEGAVIADGWDGQFARITYEVNSQLNGLHFNQVHTGAWGASMVLKFDVRFSPGNGGGADGVAVGYVPSANFGVDTRTRAPCFSEEPNLAGTFGVGFDTFNNADQGDGGESSVSLHWNNARLASVALDDPTRDPPFDFTSFETGEVFHVTITVVPGANQSTVSVEVENDIGGTINPFTDFVVPGLTSYDGRLAFGSRTGGANSNQDVDNISLSFGGTEKLHEDFEAFVIPPPPSVRFDLWGSTPSGAVKSDVQGWDGQFARLTTEVNDQLNTMSFNPAHTGVYDEMLIKFDFRISVGTNGGADGISVAYLNVANYGADTSAIGPAMSEEPNLAGSFGVGFDTFNNAGDGGESSASLHFNGAVVAAANYVFDGTEIPSLEVGQVFKAEILIAGEAVTVNVEAEDGTRVTIFDAFTVPGLTPYDGRLAFGARTGGANANHDIDNISLTVDGTEKMSEDFEGFDVPEDRVQQPPELSGGTPFTLKRFGGLPEPTVFPADGVTIPANGSPTEKEGVLRLTHEVGGQVAACAFEQTSDAVGTITATVKLRGLDTGLLGRADGMGILFVPVDTYGTTGADLIPNFNPMEDPNLAGAFGVGWDTFNANNGADSINEPEPNIGNHLSLHWDASRLIEKHLDRASEIDLVNGVFNTLTIEAYQTPDGYNASVTLVDGTDGSEHFVFQDEPIPGMAFGPGGARLLLVARTGGAADNYEFDEVRVTYDESTKAAAVLRSFAASSYTNATTPVGVTILVDDLQTADAAFNLTLTETLPAGWSASAISNGGTLAGGKVSWSLAGVTADTSLTYTATPPNANDKQPAVFRGVFVAGAAAERRVGGASSVPYAPLPFGRGEGVALIDKTFDDEIGACPTGFQCNGTTFTPIVDAAGGFRLLQDGVGNTASSAIWTTPIDLSQNSFTAEFTLHLGNVDGQTPADGVTFAILDASAHTPAALGIGGGGMGYQGLTRSLAVEFDGWDNGGEPSGYNGVNAYPHVAVVRDGAISHVQTMVDYNPDLRPVAAGGTGWLPFEIVDAFDELGLASPIDVVIDYNNGSIAVFLSSPPVGFDPSDALADEQVLDTQVLFSAPPGGEPQEPVLQSALIGFTGGTGGASLTARIENLKFTVYEATGGDQPKFIRGDCNGDGQVGGVSDAIFQLTLNFVGGVAAKCKAACDANGDGAIGGVSDAILNLTRNFIGGVVMIPPFPGCGTSDRAQDETLGCEESTCQ